HYIRLAGRHLAKQKLLAGINIIGLSLGLACCILLILYGVNELNYDNWHVHADRLYRVDEVFNRDDVQYGEAGLWTPLGPAMKKEFPDVVDYARISSDSREIVRVNDKLTPMSVTYADPQVFSLFTFPLLKGDPATALKNPHNIVLTRDKAMQL